MTTSGSVSRWLNRLQAGDREAAQQLWQRYFHRLVFLARGKLQAVPRAAADEEDVALSAFDSFCRRAEQGQFPQLADRDDLWEVLALLTARKAHDLVEYETRGKRDWRKVQPETEAGASPDAQEPLLLRLAAQEPDPAFAAEMADQYRQLFAELGDDELRTIAMRKLEGFTNEEIAGELDYAVATVERRLQLIRRTWEDKLGP